MDNTVVSEDYVTKKIVDKVFDLWKKESSIISSTTIFKDHRWLQWPGTYM